MNETQLTVVDGILTENSSTLAPVLPVRSGLNHYLNAKVMVYYNSQSSYSDTGRITYLDTHWIELTKENGERLLVPTAAVRILKLLEVNRHTEDAATLLRPVE